MSNTFPDVGFAVEFAFAKGLSRPEFDAALAALSRLVEAAEQARDDGFDAGMESVNGEIVCSVCGHNHDRDESAACDGCVGIRFDEYVVRVSAAEEQAQRDARTGMGAAERFREQGIKDAERADLAESRLRTAETALRDCASSAGMPDAGDGCRAVIKIVKETLEAVSS